MTAPGPKEVELQDILFSFYIFNYMICNAIRCGMIEKECASLGFKEFYLLNKTKMIL